MNPFLLAVVLHAAPSDLAPEGVAFADAAQKARHAALRKWMEAHSKGFRHQPLRAAGNFLTERWCSPAVAAAACEGGAVVSATARGAADRTLEALRYQLLSKASAGRSMQAHAGQRAFDEAIGRGRIGAGEGRRPRHRDEGSGAHRARWWGERFDQ